MRIYDFPRDSRNRAKMPQVVGIDKVAQKISGYDKENGESEGAVGSGHDSPAAEIEKTKKKIIKKKKTGVS